MIGQPRGMSLRDYANNRGSGSGGKFLKKWKDDGSIVVWPHPRAMVLTIYRHGFTRVEPREDRTTYVKTREVWFDPLTCWEDPEVVEKQYFRDRDTGKREHPPRVCPICLMVEHLHQLIEDRKIDWRTPIFKFEGTDPSKTKVLHAGGITGHFNAKNLSDAKKQELQGNLPDGSPDPKWAPARWLGPVYQKGPKAAFMEDLRASASVVFTVVSEADPRAGVQLTIEAKGLGSKFQDMMAKQIEGAKSPTDPDGLAGDLESHPYAVKWTYDGENPNPGEKYDSIAMTRIPMGQAVRDLLNTAPPSLDQFSERFNLRTIRARMEEHLLLPALKPHLDRYFAPAFELEKQELARKPAASPAPAPQSVPTVGRGFVGESPAPARAPAPAAPSEETFSCSLTPGCPGIMRAEDATCPACHAVYIVDAEPPPPPPPAPRPRPRPGPQSQQVAAPPLTPGLAADPSMAGPDPLGLTPESQELPAPDEGGNPNAGYPGDPNDDIPF